MFSTCPNLLQLLINRFSCFILELDTDKGRLKHEKNSVNPDGNLCLYISTFWLLKKHN